MNFNLMFGAFAHEKREKAGYTYEVICKSFGLAPTSTSLIWRLETGQAKWTLDKMSDLAALYGQTLSNLLIEFEIEAGIFENGASVLVEVNARVKELLEYIEKNRT